MTQKNGGSAFPMAASIQKVDGGIAMTMQRDGMTLRDAFALAAMEALISKIKLESSFIGDGSAKELAVARGAYSYADAMLEIRGE